MRHEVQQFEMLHRLALDAQSRGKRHLIGVSWHPLDGAVSFGVDTVTSIRSNGDGFDIYNSRELAQINVSYEEALDIVMASAVLATFSAEQPAMIKPKPKSWQSEAARRGWQTRRGDKPSKISMIAEMLKRGTTSREVCTAMGWKSVSLRRAADLNGLTLVRLGDRYYGKAKEPEPELSLEQEAS